VLGFGAVHFGSEIVGSDPQDAESAQAAAAGEVTQTFTFTNEGVATYSIPTVTETTPPPPPVTTTVTVTETTPPATTAPPPVTTAPPPTTTAPPPTTTEPPPVTPDLFVTPTGNDSSACTQAAPCRSLNTAYQKALAGQVVQVAAGSYVEQTVQKASNKTVGSAEVKIIASGVASMPDLTSYANDVHYIGFKVGDAANVRSGKNVIVENFTGQKPYVWAASNANGGPPQNVTFKGGVYRGITTCSGGESAQFKAYGGGGDDQNVANQPKNIVLDGIDLGNFELPAGCGGTPHLDCIHVYTVSGFTIKNSKVHDCEHFAVLAGSNQTTAPDNYLIENNMMWNSGITDFRFRGDTCSGSCFEKFDGVVVRHNSFETEGAALGTAAYTNAVWQDNLELDGHNCAGAVFGGNITQSGTQCSGDTRVSNLGVVNAGAGNFHLLATSPAINTSKGSAHPARDIDGQLRDSQPDVGADESG
jgi:hypothetical protein